MNQGIRSRCDSMGVYLNSRIGAAVKTWYRCYGDGQPSRKIGMVRPIRMETQVQLIDEHPSSLNMTKYGQFTKTL